MHRGNNPMTRASGEGVTGRTSVLGRLRPTPEGRKTRHQAQPGGVTAVPAQPAALPIPRLRPGDFFCAWSSLCRPPGRRFWIRRAARYRGSMTYVLFPLAILAFTGLAAWFVRVVIRNFDAASKGEGGGG